MINFTVVRWKNLLSSGNTFTELALNEHQTTLVLGENGAGKSTLLDALCFGLYGRGFRNLKKELLINSVNEKALLVEVVHQPRCNSQRLSRTIRETDSKDELSFIYTSLYFRFSKLCSLYAIKV